MCRLSFSFLSFLRLGPLQVLQPLLFLRKMWILMPLLIKQECVLSLYVLLFLSRLQETPDGNVLITNYVLPSGSTLSGWCNIKLVAATGALMWSYCYTGPVPVSPFSHYVLSDGTFYLVGAYNTTSSASSEYFVYP